MIGRWLTQRCRDEDVPRSRQVRPGLARFLEQQHPQPSLTEPWEGRTRPDTWTWHHGVGRGVNWLDRDRDVLWLLCFADEHDGGYDLGHALVSTEPGEDRLYPHLDPTFRDAGIPTAEWGEFEDEDAIEWARFLHGASEFFDERHGELEDGDTLEWKVAGLIRLQEDEDLLKMTIGTRLVYPEPAIDRDRYLSSGEVEEVFLQLTGDLEDDLWEAHVPPYAHGYVNYLFVPPRPDAGAWLAARIIEVVSAQPRRGYDPTRI